MAVLLWSPGFMLLLGLPLVPADLAGGNGRDLPRPGYLRILGGAKGSSAFGASNRFQCWELWEAGCPLPVEEGDHSGPNAWSLIRRVASVPAGSRASRGGVEEGIFGPSWEGQGCWARRFVVPGSPWLESHGLGVSLSEGGGSQARWKTRVLPRRDAPCGDVSFACDPVTRCLRVRRGTSDVGGEWSPLGAWRRAHWTIGGLEHRSPAGKGPVIPLLCPHHFRYGYPSSPRQLPSLRRLESYGAGPRGWGRHTTCY